MKKIIIIIFLLILFPTTASAKTTDAVNLKVPFTSEIPGGKWVKPWNNACEEASIVMVAQYYLGNHTSKLSATTATKLMWPLFGYEDKLWHNNADSSATRTAKLINDYAEFGAYIKNNPTVDDIKTELKYGRPVISFHYGFDLKNSNIPWRRGGSYYHVMPITGYDDDKQEFIVDDPGNHSTGLDYRYKYAIIMGSLHDFNYKNGKADGPALVLFTTPKLAKVINDPAVYFINDGVKHHVANSSLIKSHGWSWKMLKTVDAVWLNKIPTGDEITQ